MKKLIVAVSCALALAAGAVHAKEWKDIRIAFDVPYKPFEFKKPNGELTGFEVELARAMCKEMDAKCDLVVQSWDGMIPGLQARKFDAVMSSMSITAKRAEQVLFSEPYYNTPGAWFAKKSTDLDPSNKDEMKGKAVGVQRGTTMDTYVTQNMGDYVKVKRYNTADDMLLDLEGERINVIFLDYPVGQQVILSQDGYKVVGDKVKLGKGMAVAMRQRNKDLAEQINKALDKLKNDGTYDKIMKKYFDFDIKM